MSAVKYLKQTIQGVLNPLLLPRRMHAYCIGTMKSGTHSLFGMTNTGLRSRHEPDVQGFLPAIIKIREGTMSPTKAKRYIRARDRRLWLEFDSSTFNIFITQQLVEVFPQARFILTIRDCYTWLDSCINHLLSRDMSAPMRDFLNWCLKPQNYPYPSHEKVLEAVGLPAIDCLLSYWAWHNGYALEKVPQQQLLVVRTNEIRRDASPIATFLNLTSTKVDLSKDHLFKTGQKFDLLAKIDKNHLEDRVHAHCALLMQQFFPHIASADDAFKKHPNSSETQLP
jgi:hypothetical protein